MRALTSLPGWVEWKAAATRLQEVRQGVGGASRLSPLDLTMEDVIPLTDSCDPWESLDPIVSGYAKVIRAVQEKGRVDELRRQVEASEQWKALLRIDRQWKAALADDTQRLRATLGAPAQPPPAPNAAAAARSGNAEQVGAAAASTDSAAPPAAADDEDSSSESSSPPPWKPSAVSKKDPASKLAMPSWCLAIEQDPYAVVPPQCLGLVNPDVYYEMCHSERHQVQRLWSSPSPRRSLYAAVIHAERFHVELSPQPPSDAEVDGLARELRQSISGWSEEELSEYIPDWDPDTMASSDYVAVHATDVELLWLWRAVNPSAPLVYVILVQRKPEKLSFAIVGEEPPQHPDARCIVLYCHQLTDGSHVEVLGRKRSARGPSALKTVFLYSDPIVQSLEAWYSAHVDTKSDRKAQTPRRKRARASSEEGSVGELDVDLNGDDVD